jgi:hypothetical protein
MRVSLFSGGYDTGLLEAALKGMVGQIEAGHR